MDLNRSSGILLHITSLPSPFGIGDMGPESYEFVDFLETSGCKYWQVLPVTPTNATHNHSPYSSDSAFAGNILLISPELLEKEGYIDLHDFSFPEIGNPHKIDFEKVLIFKEKLLDAAYKNFKNKKLNYKNYKNFCETHDEWLDHYSLYKVIQKKFNSSWFFWPKEYRDRESSLLIKTRKELKNHIEREKFNQFLFFSQWKHLSTYARQHGVQLIGDIPIFVNHDSADCWVNHTYFKLNDLKFPTKVSGVPPDYFSETGQLWGTPVYNWKNLKSNNFDWWIKRIRQNLLLFDLVRLDHFRGFSACWEVPAGETTAAKGKWVKTPGHDLFRIIKREFPLMPFIAEDLGSLDSDVYKLMETFQLPGMNVLQFAFGEDKIGNPYLPFNHRSNSLVYTGTHDNNTAKGWFINANISSKLHLQDYTDKKVTAKNIHLILQRMALASVSKVAIIPMQDILGLDSDAVMNIPGSLEGNWIWRLTYSQLSDRKSAELKTLNELYGRVDLK